MAILIIHIPSQINLGRNVRIKLLFFYMFYFNSKRKRFLCERNFWKIYTLSSESNYPRERKWECQCHLLFFGPIFMQVDRQTRHDLTRAAAQNSFFGKNFFFKILTIFKGGFGQQQQQRSHLSVLSKQRYFRGDIKGKAAWRRGVINTKL